VDPIFEIRRAEFGSSELNSANNECRNSVISHMFDDNLL